MRSTIIKYLLVCAVVVCPVTVVSGQTADLVLVEKSESLLHLIRDGEVFASYRVKFGKNPRGHKQQQGDSRTPEGRYILDYKNPNSAFYKSIHVSYPNAQDRASARRRGVDPGGDIMIHGQANGWRWLTPLSQLFNWTDGCVALTDQDMDAVWNSVPTGTPIEIKP